MFTKHCSLNIVHPKSLAHSLEFQDSEFGSEMNKLKHDARNVPILWTAGQCTGFSRACPLRGGR